MNDIKEHYKKIGKAGAKIRWSGRYQYIEELRKHYDKAKIDEFIKWPTKYLKQLVEAMNKYKK